MHDYQIGQFTQASLVRLDRGTAQRESARPPAAEIYTQVGMHGVHRDYYRAIEVTQATQELDELLIGPKYPVLMLNVYDVGLSSCYRNIDFVEADRFGY